MTNAPGEPAGSWPKVGYEPRDWTPRTRYAVPAGSRLAGTGRYRAAVPAMIAELPDVALSPTIRALMTEAATEIARFDAEVGADVAPFSAVLLRSESAASSRIENLTASAKAIALAEAGAQSRENASIIVANTSAMRAAIALADQLDAGAILKMHEALMAASSPQWAGRWRDDQVWIGGSQFYPHGADFVAPHQDRVPAAIDDLVRFLLRADLPPLVQAAIAHAQFETIHPFPDGNGRTGRALVHSVLRGKGLTRQVTVPVSAGLLSNTAAYFDALGAYRQGEPEPIVAMIGEACFAAVNNGRRLVEELHGVRAGWNDRIKARADAVAWRVADVLLGQPVLDSVLIQRQLGVSDVAALRAINQLVDAEVLAKVGARQRDRKYAAGEILAALDAFAARSGRRGGF